MYTLTWLTFLPLLTAGIVLLIEVINRVLGQPFPTKGLIKFLSVVGSFLTFIIATGITRDYINSENMDPNLVEGLGRSADTVLAAKIEGELVGLEDSLRNDVQNELDTLDYFGIRDSGRIEPDAQVKIDTPTRLGSEGMIALERAAELKLASQVKQAERIRYVEFVPWIGRFKINYFMGADGLSLPLIWLTALLGVLCLVYSWTIDKGTEGYYILFLLLETGLIGVFCALDFFLFYVFWELVLLPMYFLIGIWGGPNRIYAAIKFFIYTMVGGALMLLAMLVLYFWYEPHSFNMLTLMHEGMAPSFAKLAPVAATLVFVALFINFAIKLPVVPFHTWLPDAHVEAPTAVSVVLAGVLLKMGGYGFFRVLYPMLPHTALQRGMVFTIAILGVINIIYGAFCALAQRDFKKLVAYSSVSHMGYVLLGLAALSYTGISGAVLQMFTHGISSAMLFLIVGVIYDRAHHRNLDDFGGIGLQMPWYTGIATVGFFTALGLPGLCGFVSEALVFIGAWDTSMGLITTDTWTSSLGAEWIIYVSLLGIILGAAYILWTVQRVYLGKLQDKYKNFKDVSFREVVALVPLAVLCVVVGVFPHQTILKHIQPSLSTMTDMVRGVDNSNLVNGG